MAKQSDQQFVAVGSPRELNLPLPFFTFSSSTVWLLNASFIAPIVVPTLIGPYTQRTCSTVT